jgi:hypothetical protein
MLADMVFFHVAERSVIAGAPLDQCVSTDVEHDVTSASPRSTISCASAMCLSGRRCPMARKAAFIQPLADFGNAGPAFGRVHVADDAAWPVVLCVLPLSAIEKRQADGRALASPAVKIGGCRVTTIVAVPTVSLGCHLLISASGKRVTIATVIIMAPDWQTGEKN